MITFAEAVNVNHSRSWEGGLQIGQRIMAVKPQMPNVYTADDREAVENGQNEIERITFEILDGEPLEATHPIRHDLQRPNRLPPPVRKLYSCYPILHRPPVEVQYIRIRREGARAVNDFPGLEQREVIFFAAVAQTQVEGQMDSECHPSKGGDPGEFGGDFGRG